MRATLPAAHRRTRSTGRMQRNLENIWEIETSAQYFRLPEHLFYEYERHPDRHGRKQDTSEKSREENVT